MNNGGVLRIATFDKLYDVNEAPAPEECINESIVLLTDTMDALIFHGHWKIYGNLPLVAENLPKPRFKLGLDPTYVTNYEQTRRRLATPVEIEEIDHKFSVAPIRVQNAMQAYHGLKLWDSDFEKLTLRYCIEKSKIPL
jgi:hypothetical protein